MNVFDVKSEVIKHTKMLNRVYICFIRKVIN